MLTNYPPFSDFCEQHQTSSYHKCYSLAPVVHMKAQKPLTRREYLRQEMCCVLCYEPAANVTSVFLSIASTL